MQHYSVLVNLLRGRWEYQDDGLLDRTHLRFFTLQGIHELFAQAGLKVFEVQPRWWPDAGFEQFQKLIAPLASALAIDTKSLAVQARAVQYVVRAVRAGESIQRMFAWSLLGSTVGSDVRVGEPNQFLATIPGVRVRAGTQVLFDELATTWPGEARVFIEQRVIIPLADHERLQRALLAENYLIVGEFDDDPDHFPDLARTNHFALAKLSLPSDNDRRHGGNVAPLQSPRRRFPKCRGRNRTAARNGHRSAVDCAGHALLRCLES